MAVRRLDFRNTHGWQVEIKRIKHTKMFSDGVHDGKEKAYKAARAYEAEIKATLDPVMLWNVPRPIDRPLPNNKSTGLCGISDTYSIDRRKPGHPKQLRFSIHIGPLRAAARSYNEDNRADKLEEAIAIRKAAIKYWPNFTAEDAQAVSEEFWSNR